MKHIKLITVKALFSSIIFYGVTYSSFQIGESPEATATQAMWTVLDDGTVITAHMAKNSSLQYTRAGGSYLDIEIEPSKKIVINYPGEQDTCEGWISSQDKGRVRDLSDEELKMLHSFCKEYRMDTTSDEFRSLVPDRYRWFINPETMTTVKKVPYSYNNNSTYIFGTPEQMFIMRRKTGGTYEGIITTKDQTPVNSQEAEDLYKICERIIDTQEAKKKNVKEAKLNVLEIEPARVKDVKLHA